MDLALDSVAVFERFTMKMLIAIVAAQRLHVGHPEMVGERTDLAHCLFEGVLDLEAQSVQTNDVEGVEGSVGAHEEAGASYRVDHCHEAHQPAGRTPQQIADPILDDHLVLAVDGTWGLLEVPGGLQQGAELDLPAIDPGAAWLARPALLVSGIGDGVGLHPGEQVVVLFEQADDDLVGGIVGVSDEVEGLFDGGDTEECEHFVEQGSAVAIGPHHSLVDADGERHGEEAGGGLNEQAYRRSAGSTAPGTRAMTRSACCAASDAAMPA